MVIEEKAKTYNMYKRKRINNFTKRVHRIYDKKLFFIEKVINSCVTLDQLYSAGGWAATVIEQYHKHELDRLSQLLNLFLHIEMHNVVNEYFFLKQDIINLVVERKMEDIDRQEDTENIEND